MNEDELRIVRRAYAKHIMADLQADDARVEEAFATIPREAFLGPGPWPVLRSGGRYVRTPDADPVHLYTNDLVGIDLARRLNNGQPSLHACLMAACAPGPGEHAVHVGAGVGYYSAILGQLVGAGGQVTAIEFEPALAARARPNLAPYPQVEVTCGDGSVADFAPADVIYVNAGATRPAEAWLDRLKPGGRMILPLTTDGGFAAGPGPEMARHGAVFLITRSATRFAARRVSPVAIYPCVGLRDERSERALAAAFAKGDGSSVTELVRRDDCPEAQCWLRGEGWSLLEAGEAAGVPLLPRGAEAAVSARPRPGPP